MDNFPPDQGKFFTPGFFNADPPAQVQFALTAGDAGLATSIGQAGGSVAVDTSGIIDMVTFTGDITIAAGPDVPLAQGTIALVNDGTITITTGSTVGDEVLTLSSAGVLSLTSDNAGVSITSAGGVSGVVDITNAGTVAFDALGAGALTNVQTINGAVYPPAGTSATSITQADALVACLGNGAVLVSSIGGGVVVDVMNAGTVTFDTLGFGALVNLSTINGQSWVNGSTYVLPGDISVSTITGVSSIVTDPTQEFRITQAGAFNVNISSFGNVKVTGADLDFVGNNVYIYNVGGPPLLSATSDTLSLSGVTTVSMTAGEITSLSTINGFDYNNPAFSTIVGISSIVANPAETFNIVNTGAIATGLNISTLGAVRIETQDEVTIPSVLNANIVNPAGGTNTGSVGDSGTVWQNIYANNSYFSSILGVSTINGAAYVAPLGAFVDSYQIYVSPNGNDTTGTGSAQNPYATVGRAITKRATLSTSIECSIILSSGTYTESFTLAQNTFLSGLATGEANQPCNIVGNVVLSGTAGVIGLAGLQITAPASGLAVSVAGAGATYTIFNCNITAVGAGAITFSQGVSFVTESRIIGSNTAAQAIVIGSGATATFRNSAISNQVSNTTSLISSNGTLTMRDCTVLSLNTASTALQALVQIGGSANKTVDIALTTLAYTNTVTDVGGNKCCVQFNNSTNTITASIVNCVLLCEGAITGSPQIQCIQDPGTGIVLLSYGNLLAGATAHHISGNITKVELTTVP